MQYRQVSACTQWTKDKLLESPTVASSSLAFSDSQIEANGIFVIVRFLPTPGIAASPFHWYNLM